MHIDLQVCDDEDVHAEVELAPVQKHGVLNVPLHDLHEQVCACVRACVRQTNQQKTKFISIRWIKTLSFLLFSQPQQAGPEAKG